MSDECCGVVIDSKIWFLSRPKFSVLNLNRFRHRIDSETVNNGTPDFQGVNILPRLLSRREFLHDNPSPLNQRTFDEEV